MVAPLRTDNALSLCNALFHRIAALPNMKLNLTGQCCNQARTPAHGLKHSHIRT